MDLVELLAQNQKYRLDTPVPSEGAIAEAEQQLGHGLPYQYKAFIRLGGLNDLRFHCELLAPSEIVENRKYIRSEKYTPFASNGCGDLYCWPLGEDEDPPVFFWDHESNEFSACGGAFTEWLAAQRF